MSTTAPKPVTTPIPVQLSKPEFTTFIPTATLPGHTLEVITIYGILCLGFVNLEMSQRC
jgi:hypothetical protein